MDANCRVGSFEPETTIQRKMIEKNTLTSRQLAKIAGISLIIMFAAAMLAEFYAHQTLIVPGNATQTAQNILNNRLDFCIGIVGFIIVLICDLVVAWALYFFLKPINAHVSLLAAWIRLVYTAIFAMAVFYMLMGYRVLIHYPAQPGAIANHQQAMVFFNLFGDVWAFGLIFFGCHLGVVGYLIVKSRFIPRFLGAILLLAAVAYLADNFSKLMMPGYEAYASVFVAIVAVTAITGEVGLAVWLLYRGGKQPLPA
jgi:hypothetical protein